MLSTYWLFVHRPARVSKFIMGDSFICAGCGCHELISRWSIHYAFAESLVEAPINGYKGGGGGGALPWSLYLRT